MLFLSSQVVGDAVQTFCSNFGLLAAIFHYALIERTGLFIQTIVKIGFCLLESHLTFRSETLTTFPQFGCGIRIIGIDTHNLRKDVCSCCIVKHAVHNVSIGAEFEQRVHLSNIGIIFHRIHIGTLLCYHEPVTRLLVVGILDLTHTHIAVSTVTTLVHQRVRVGNLECTQLLGLQVQGDIYRVISWSHHGDDTSSIAWSGGELDEINRVCALKLRAEKIHTLIHR